jgi:succinylarginine dihydrolase
MRVEEVNFDGIVGPTHTYSGLSYGNLASLKSKNSVSNPREAALQGLEKMLLLFRMGFMQGIIPPQERPYLPILRQIGFCGSDKKILAKVSNEYPELFTACCSAASMWTANAATISPSIDSADSLLHITPANLSSKFHRSFEHQTTSKALKAIFSDENYFVHHPILPQNQAFSDEGAANHTRFCKTYGESGLHLFVYGREAFSTSTLHSLKFPARQTLEASQAIARLHQIPSEKVIFAQQNPKAIDAGVFHNDVISVGNTSFFLYHELAFVETHQVVDTISEKMENYCNSELFTICVEEKAISLKDAVTSYLFNSQILSNKTGMILLAPLECSETAHVKQFLESLPSIPNCPIKNVQYINLKESMLNGGGPACLRLRIVLNEQELKKMNSKVLINETLYQQLVEWVKRNYRDRLASCDLNDPHLFDESESALDELTKILNLGNIYSFQTIIP